MKSLIITALFLFSFSALACPDLTGNYQCPYHKLTITQKNTSKNEAIYTLTNPHGFYNVVADGKDIDHGSYTTRSFCEGNVVKVVAGKYFFPTTYIYALTNAGDFHISVRGDDEKFCYRIN